MRPAEDIKPLPVPLHRPLRPPNRRTMLPHIQIPLNRQCLIVQVRRQLPKKLHQPLRPRYVPTPGTAVVLLHLKLRPHPRNRPHVPPKRRLHTAPSPPATTFSCDIHRSFIHGLTSRAAPPTDSAPANSATSACGASASPAQRPRAKYHQQLRRHLPTFSRSISTR